MLCLHLVISDQAMEKASTLWARSQLAEMPHSVISLSQEVKDLPVQLDFPSL
jgi:hypothetical protein